MVNEFQKTKRGRPKKALSPPFLKPGPPVISRETPLEDTQAKVRIQARGYTQAAFDTLLDVCACHEANAMARFRAAAEILDRGWGKTVNPPEQKSTSATSIKVQFAEANKTIDAIVDDGDPQDC